MMYENVGLPSGTLVSGNDVSNLSGQIAGSLFPGASSRLIAGSTGSPILDSHSGSSVDTTGQDSDLYGSSDVHGFDQAAWALEQQWKMDEAERQFNSAEAAKQRDWEKMMSDTAISRAVADIKAAGLNPWLALNGGSLGAASTPSGASASASSGSSKVPQSYMYSLINTVISSASSLLGNLAKIGAKFI